MERYIVIGAIVGIALLVGWYFRLSLLRIPVIARWAEEKMVERRFKIEDELPGRFAGEWSSQDGQVIGISFGSEGVHISGSEVLSYHGPIVAVAKHWFSVDMEDWIKFNFRIDGEKLVVERIDIRTMESELLGVFQRLTIAGPDN